MLKKEQQFTTKLQKWLRYNWKESSAFEVKVARDGKRFPYKELYSHQIRALLRVKKSFVYKIPDLGSQNPFDVFTLYNTGAYVILKFIRRGNKTFYVIDIEDFISHRDKSKAKSITENEAKHIAYLVGVHI